MNRPTLLRTHITTIGQFGVHGTVAFHNTSISSSILPTANRAMYVPISLPAPATIARFFSVHGSSASGNMDIGIYDTNFVKLHSTGTTARSGATSVQYVSVTDYSLKAGHYYLALVQSAGSTAGYTLSFLSQAVAAGYMQENLGSALLPDVATPIRAVLGPILYYGFTQSEVI